MQLGARRRGWLGIIFQGALVLALALASPARAQQLTERQVQTIRTEIDAFLDQYYEWFSAGDAEALAQRAYAAPLLVQNGPVPQTANEVRQWASDLLERLAAQGYGRSEMPDRNICVLTGGLALVSGHGFRYRQDGSVLNDYGWTYALLQRGEGWRIEATLQHAPEAIVRCAK